MVDRATRWSLAALIVVAALVGPATANYLILTPTATTLTTGQVRAEAALSPDNTNSRYYWLATGLQQYELNAIRLERPGLSAQNMVGIQASFLPETSLNPAVAFGIRDAASQSPNGIGIYAVVTRHIPVGAASVIVKDFATTAGVGLFGIRGPFTSFEAKLPMNIFVQGEYDSHDVNAAVGWQPTKLFRVKAYSISKDLYFGAELVPVTF
jgi:hypothetical protein